MGIPEIVRTDNGPQFTGEFKEFSKQYGFSHITSSPHFPQSNGSIEAAVKIAKNIIKKCDDMYLGLLAYRSSPLENGFSPAELLYSRKIRSQVPIAPNQMKRVIPDDIVQAKEKVRKAAIEHNFNLRHRTRKLSDLEKDDMVWISDLRVYGQILGKADEPRSYIVKTQNGKVRRNRWHLVPAPYKKTPEAIDFAYGEGGVDGAMNAGDEPAPINGERAEAVLQAPDPQVGDADAHDEREVRVRRPPVWHQDYVFE